MFSWFGINSSVSNFTNKIADAQGCVTMCVSDAGCNVTMVQTADAWTASMVCDGSYYDLGNGDGQYSGTICNGVSPCSVSEASLII